VEFEGFISEADKPGYLGSANIAIFPSTGGESFGIVLIEAMAANSGIVVGGDNPGYRSVIGRWPDTLIDVKHPTIFAGQLAKLIADADLRKQIHQQQQTEVVKYDVRTVGPALLNLYATPLPTETEVR
jgi:phosphatidylinositol alpha-mannosyltransferase